MLRLMVLLGADYFACNAESEIAGVNSCKKSNQVMDRPS